MRNKKSQAALEFIMTYGWMMLMIVVAAGVIATTIIWPSDIAEDTCLLNSIPCTSFNAVEQTNPHFLDSGLYIQIEFKNPEYDIIKFTNYTTTKPIILNGNEVNSYCDFTPETVNVGKSVIIRCEINGESTHSGDKIFPKIKYTVADKTFPKYLKGELTIFLN